MATEIDSPENTNGVNDDTSSCTSGSLAVLYALVESDFFLISGDGGTRVPEHKEYAIIIAEMQHEAHSSEASLLGQSGTEAGSRLFVGNLTMHSEASSSLYDLIV